MVDTTNGMLTERQREWLRGEFEYDGEYANQQRYEMRQRMKKRVKLTMEDFSLLLDNLDDLPADIVEEGGVDAFAFLLAHYLQPDSEDARAQLRDQIAEGEGASQHDQREFLAFVLEKALDRAAEARNHPRRYDVEITPREKDRRGAQEFIRDIQSGSLSRERFEDLYHEGRVDTDVFVEVMAEIGTDEE